MFRTFVGLVSCTVTLCGCAGCGPGPVNVDSAGDPSPTVTERTASLDDTVSLAVGETLAVQGVGTATLVRVVSDSRCPEGVTCVWEGDAEVLIRIESETGTVDASLHTTLEPASVPVGPWVLELLDVLPHPTLDPLADPPAPHAVLRLTSLP